MRYFAAALDCHLLVRAADRFIQKHFVAVSTTDDFKQLQVIFMFRIKTNFYIYYFI